eukprot:Blabericola_migrator_1__8937@NODE_4739_length_999_cov_910_480687_g2949_i0_p1_GENE_NODE_4739_length_999_cov_910_480687_g2949_i0NODE_4739_length_999_cov_910_480687_g2949_i0_p1_ORF_typecomplete_len208_score46_18GST_N/PF02798_20/6_3e09GST_C_3/PF14497_6/5_2e06GST_N_3/PF13417_6/2_3e05GST_C/PF00043_25/0_08_NODE_4739_length_999_cov_910_480687_g2949_i088711
MSSPKLTLHYFPLAFRGEPIRCALVASGLEHQDIRHEFADFAKNVKPMSPTGQVPMLEIDGTPYVETIPILNYVCRLAGMVSQDPLEMLKHDMIASRLDGYSPLVGPVLFVSDEERPAKVIEVTEKLKEFLNVAEGLVKNHAAEPGHILKGKAYSPADLMVYCIVRDLLTNIEGINVGDVPTQWPSLYAIHQGVLQSNPSIKTYHSA